MIFNSSSIEYDGSTKYYKTKDSDTVHADENCKHLKGKAVTRIDGSSITDDTVKCYDCTASAESSPSSEDGEETDETGWDEYF